jgi:hypothetical protein
VTGRLHHCELDWSDLTFTVSLYLAMPGQSTSAEGSLLSSYVGQDACSLRVGPAVTAHSLTEVVAMITLPCRF